MGRKLTEGIESWKPLRKGVGSLPDKSRFLMSIIREIKARRFSRERANSRGLGGPLSRTGRAELGEMGPPEEEVPLLLVHYAGRKDRHEISLRNRGGKTLKSKRLQRWSGGAGPPRPHQCKLRPLPVGGEEQRGFTVGSGPNRRGT